MTDDPPVTEVQAPAPPDAASRTWVQTTTAPPAPAADAPPGFELLAELGRGGMGVVYRARQTDLGREVALKMILAGGHASAADLRRFETEARAVGGLEHPNVVRVFQAGSHAGQPFLAMEFLPAGTLADLLRDGPLPPREAARVVEGVARGVAACHAGGVLHRDLKPANVLLAADPAGRVPKVTDFGLAKRLDGAGELTASGAVMGSPSYMAPEQARGERAGVPADVYGLGGVLYACLTGRPAFQAPSALDVLLRVMDPHDDPLPVRTLQPGVPRDLDTVCLKCLSKDPARRYPTAAAVADDLRRWLDGVPVLARPAGPVERGWKRVRRNPAVSAFVATLAAATAVAVGLAVVAVRARQRADAEAAFATANSEFLQEVLEQASPNAQAAAKRPINPDLPVRDALAFAADKLGERYAGQPLREAAARASVGRTFRELQAPDKAAEQFAAAVALLRAHRPALDPELLAAVNDLGDSLRAANRVAEAEPLLWEALAGRRAALGDHEYVDQTLNNLGLVLLALKRYDEAEAALWEALHGRRRRLGDRHPDALRTRHNLAFFHHTRKGPGDLQAAAPLYTEALAGRRDLFGDAHPETLVTLSALAQLYRTLGRLTDAEPLFRRAVAAADAIEPAAAKTSVRRVALGQCLLELGKPAEAEPVLRAAHEKLVAQPGQGAAARTAAKLLADVCARTGRPDEAARWRQAAKP